MNGFYSQKQFDSFHDKELKYIYYVIKNQQNEEKIVQVTEVTDKSNILFDDAMNMGKIVRHLGSFSEYKSVEELNKL